jgi:hypothetical protein
VSCVAGDVVAQNGELAQVQTVLHSIPEIHDDEKTLQVRLVGIKICPECLCMGASFEMMFGCSMLLCREGNSGQMRILYSLPSCCNVCGLQAWP